MLSLEIFAISQSGYVLFDREYEDGYRGSNEVLGFGPIPGSSSRSTYETGGKVIYDVTYSVDKNGMRVGPNRNASDCILFFGGSFAYGEGVEGNETSAWIVGDTLEMGSLNFGYHGYGPHQMLMNIQSGRVQEVTHCQPIGAVYIMISHHLQRWL